MLLSRNQKLRIWEFKLIKKLVPTQFKTHRD